MLQGGKRAEPTPATLRQIAAYLAQRISEDKWPGLCVVKSKERAAALAKEIEGWTGHPTPIITGETPKTERRRVADAMRERSPAVPVAITPGAWTTGVDIPSLRWVAFCDLGQAPIWATQAAGRGSRIDPKSGKTAFDIYDFGHTEDTSARNSSAGTFCPDLPWAAEAELPITDWRSDAAFLEELMTQDYNPKDRVAGPAPTKEPERLPWYIWLTILWLLGMLPWWVCGVDL